MTTTTTDVGVAAAAAAAHPKPEQIGFAHKQEDDDFIPTNKLKMGRATLTNSQGVELPKVILVSCGSFSPITIMHLRLFEMARDWGRRVGAFNAIGGYISPVADSYGKKGLLPAVHRVNMCEKAVESSDWIMVDYWEATRQHYSYTIDVLKSFKRRITKAATPDIGVKLLCGSDLLASFNIPKVWAEQDMKDILDHFGVVCLERPGSYSAEIVESNPLMSLRKHNIVIVPQNISNDVSSTKIREALKNGCSIKYLTPDSVIDYIRENNLVALIINSDPKK
eukprot:TRINITY_DN2987_c0_g1_i4.p1 TRINITY_DN2987_c0_g1~~TRINITY_DN2987_c0_g1_i4.p1  ORF type:complete len:280 (-),score=66.83 TRINITY_DN2987_c0_g1_i4:76-915(-)